MIAFPPGEFLLEPHHIWLWTDAVQGDQDAGIHPGVAIMIALKGAAISIAGMMEQLQTEPQNVLFGELGLAFERPLTLNTLYRVDVEILSVERKSGRRFATFDRITVDYRLSEGESPVANVSQVWIVDRS